MQLAREELLTFFGGTPTRATEAFRVFCLDEGASGQVRRQPP